MMDVNLWSIEQWYLYSLIFLAICMILYLFFGDIADGIGEGIPFFNPTVILAFLTFFSATGFIIETFTTLNSYLIAIISSSLFIRIRYSDVLFHPSPFKIS